MNKEPAIPEDPRSGRSERRPVRLDGFIAPGDGSTSEITVIDMSYEGCRIATVGAAQRRPKGDDFGPSAWGDRRRCVLGP